MNACLAHVKEEARCPRPARQAGSLRWLAIGVVFPQLFTASVSTQFSSHFEALEHLWSNPSFA
jgi:hypothetical protein